jgi:4-amino-4-deoxy-L-arabinose transferase-like glycosyltransferase
LTRNRTTLPSRTRSLAARASWYRLALAVVLLLSAFLNLLWLPSEGYANIYYAATVKNMLTGWSNFFFVSFDAGFVTVDKPPLGLWVQAASAYLFGFHGWALLLPQALAGVLSVALIYHIWCAGRSGRRRGSYPRWRWLLPPSASPFNATT